MLEVLVEISYDEQCRFINEKKENESRRKFNEMCLHEQLWRVLTCYDAQRDVVRKQLVFGVLWIVLNRTNIGEREAVEKIAFLLQSERERKN